MEPTHILFTWPTQFTERLYRASDGVRIGELQKDVVIYGENPNAAANDPKRMQSRVFMPSEEGGWNEHAQRYLRTVVAQADGGEVRIEERCQEGNIILPPDSIELSVNGGSTPVLTRKFQGRGPN